MTARTKKRHPRDMPAETVARVHWCVSQIRQLAAEVEQIERDEEARWRGLPGRGSAGAYVPEDDATQAARFSTRAVFMIHQATRILLDADLDEYRRPSIAMVMRDVAYNMVEAIREPPPRRRKGTTSESKAE